MYFILQSDTKLVHSGLLSEPIFNKITKLPLNSSPSSLLLSAQQPRSGDSPPQLHLRPPSPSSSLSLYTHPTRHTQPISQLSFSLTVSPLTTPISRRRDIAGELRSAVLRPLSPATILPTNTLSQQSKSNLN